MNFYLPPFNFSPSLSFDDKAGELITLETVIKKKSYGKKGDLHLYIFHFL